MCPRELLFNAKEPGLLSGRNYDVASDGRFLMLKLPDDARIRPESIPVFVVQNWAAEFEED